MNLLEPKRQPRTRWLVVLLAAMAFISACPDEKGKAELPAEPATKAEAFADIRITDEADHLLFTYLLADGSFATTDKIASVPEKARDQVIVVDTKLSPEKRRSSQVIYVADLTNRGEDGTYSYSLVSRFRFERDLLRDPDARSDVLPPECEGLSPSPSDRVIVYSTDWCGVCKTAMAFLKKEGIPFEEKDVEKDPAAQRELTCKALKTKTRINGVPVLDVAGKLLLGFDRNRVLEAARSLSAHPKGPSTSL